MYTCMYACIYIFMCGGWNWMNTRFLSNSIPGGFIATDRQCGTPPLSAALHGAYSGQCNRVPIQRKKQHKSFRKFSLATRSPPWFYTNSTQLFNHLDMWRIAYKREVRVSLSSDISKESKFTAIIWLCSGNSTNNSSAYDLVDLVPLVWKRFG